ncbi:MAG: dihydrofolate reductase [Candidatus Omnitrophica bacterium]|nr:dihydrofolate reductase [Candidatus Omnitrophota bacterium]
MNRAFKLFHIVAVSDNGVIGKANQLPWHFSSDLKRFKQVTTGSTVLMGRKTFESIGKALPNRVNFVLSRAKRNFENVCFFSSIEEAFENVKTERCFVVGGADLYKQTFNDVDGLYVTKIHALYEGDAYYPPIPSFFCLKEKEVSEEKGVRLEFLYLENGLK